MDIKPFKAYRFNPDVVGDTGSCISPPYDVINEKQRAALLAKNPRNIVRVINSLPESDDDDNNNRYTRAADFFNKWCDEKALKQDQKDSIYAYIQNFEIAGQNIERYSFIAKAKLEPFGPVVRPHEQTLDNPIVDRLNLTRATKAAFGLVYLLYNDPKHIADAALEKAAIDKPLIDFKDEMDVRHRLYGITDTEDINAIVNMMADKNTVIADGHHRYTTAVNYAKENPDATSQMLCFSNIAHPGLVVLATHRIVSNVENFDASTFVAALKGKFDVTDFIFENDKEKAYARNKMLAEMVKELEDGKNAFGLYVADGSFRLLVLNDTNAMTQAVPDMSKAWQRLDVAVLHKLILENICGIDEKKLANQTNLNYVKDTPNAITDMIAEVDAGQKQAAIFMNPPITKQIEMVADEGEKMPQKSTYFFPKVYTGLTVDKF
jgi:uncharacterized protein (DUF1015 family)